MPGIDEPVGFLHSNSGRHYKNGGSGGSHKIIANSGETGRRWNSTPVRWQSLCGYCGPGDTVRNISLDYDKILGRIVRIDVHKVLDHGERQVFRRVGEADANTGPAPAKTIRALSIERFFRKGFAKDSVDARQLTPP